MIDALARLLWFAVMGAGALAVGAGIVGVGWVVVLSLRDLWRGPTG